MCLCCCGTSLWQLYQASCPLPQLLPTQSFHLALINILFEKQHLLVSKKSLEIHRSTLRPSHFTCEDAEGNDFFAVSGPLPGTRFAFLEVEGKSKGRRGAGARRGWEVALQLLQKVPATLVLNSSRDSGVLFGCIVRDQRAPRVCHKAAGLPDLRPPSSPWSPAQPHTAGLRGLPGLSGRIDCWVSGDRQPPDVGKRPLEDYIKFPSSISLLLSLPLDPSCPAGALARLRCIRGWTPLASGVLRSPGS